MNPRFAPSSEYLPAGTWNSKRPSSLVITDCTLCRFFASAMVTRERASGPPAFALTTVPVIRYGPDGIGVRSGFVICAGAEQRSAIQHAKSATKDRVSRRIDGDIRVIARYRNCPWKSAATSHAPSAHPPGGPQAPLNRRLAWLRDSGTRDPAGRDRTQADDKLREPVPAKRNSHPDSPRSRRTVRCCPQEECSRYVPRAARR